MMNKKLMALAVAGALAAPAAAFAQASNVQLYGRANLGIDTWSATGATAGSASDLKSRTRVYDSGSRLGVRGTEDLGGGLRAIFVIESGVNIDAGTTTNQNSTVPNASAGTLASRDSYVGLAGGWGDVRFGRQSIYWVSGPNGQTGANYINNEIGWYNGASMGRVAGPSARISNVMSYNSPTWSGFNFTASYVPNSESAAAGANTDASVWGVTLRYEGPIGIQYDHAENQQASGGAHRLKIVGNKLSVGWPYAPGSRIALMFVRNQNNDIATAVAGFSTLGDNISQSHWGVNWEHTIGNINLYGMWSRLQKASGCSGTGCDGTESTGITLGVRYNFSKRTAVYTSYIKHNNGSNQTADIIGGGYSSAPATGVAAGADPKIFAVGVWHSF